MRRPDRRYWQHRRAAMYVLHDSGRYTQQDIADLVGLDRTTVAYHLNRRTFAPRQVLFGVPSRINADMQVWRVAA